MYIIQVLHSLDKIEVYNVLPNTYELSFRQSSISSFRHFSSDKRLKKEWELESQAAHDCEVLRIFISFKKTAPLLE